MMEASIQARALRIIRDKGVSTRELATSLGISERTAARVVSALRKEGYHITSARDGRGWKYRIEDDRPPRGEDPLLRLAGFVRTGLKDGSVNHDLYLYGYRKRDRRRRGVR